MFESKIYAMLRDYKWPVEIFDNKKWVAPIKKNKRSMFGCSKVRNNTPTVKKWAKPIKI